MEELRKLSPIQEQIIDKTIENVTGKLIAGYRNKSNVPPKGMSPGPKATAHNTLNAASAQSAIDVANRGAMWKEMVSKTFSHGVSSLATLQFDSQFTVVNGVASGLDAIAKTAGVYVVHDSKGNVRYIGDAENVQQRWISGHLNENRQKQRAGQAYKLHDELTDGCVVKVINCDSKESAAALEAKLINEARSSDDYDVINSREELKEEQGSRSNIEAKKLKEHLDSATELAKGAATEAIKNGSWMMIEQAITECVQALKSEIIDFFLSGKHQFVERLKRLLTKVVKSIRKQLGNILDMAKGVFEFIVNAFSQAIGQVYQLAKNIYDLGVSAWQLYKNREAMTRDELTQKIVETIVISGNVTFWSATDLLIETQLTPYIGPMAPFVAAFISALGFGITSHYLNEFVPQIVDFIIGGYAETKEHLQKSAQLLVESSQMNANMVSSLETYLHSSAALIDEAQWHTEKLSTISSRHITVREEIQF